jgi:phage tail-like protein
MQYRLRIYGPGGLQDFVLPIGEFIVGRNPLGPNKLTVPLDYLLDTHLVFHTAADQSTVIVGAATQPAHDTRLNGQPVRTNLTTRLQDGDLLTIRHPTKADQMIALLVEIFGQEPASALLPTPAAINYQVPPGLRCQSVRLLQLLPAIYQPERPLLDCLDSQGGAVAATDGAAADMLGAMRCATCGRRTPVDLAPDTFLSRYLALFETLLLPLEGAVANFDLFLNPRTAPDAFLPWLESWFELEALWTVAQRRALLASFPWRGTRLGLYRLLETYTGQRPLIIDDDAQLPPHTFRVVLPVSLGELAQRQITEASIRQLLDLCKPAHTTYELEFQPVALTTAGA